MSVLFEETLPGGWAWSHILKKGTALRLTDPTGGACAALTFYNPKDLSERYNFPDTLKGQYTARLTRGHALYSDMGRVAMTIIEDSFGAHDPLAGLLTQTELEARFGIKTYQDHRNAWHQSGLNQLWTEIGKYALDQRDLSSVVNFFAAVSVDAEGRMSWDASRARSGHQVVLQAEMDSLVVVVATQHPYDPRPVWQPQPVQVQVIRSALPITENPAWAYSEQNQRGLTNTYLYNL